MRSILIMMSMLVIISCSNTAKQAAPLWIDNPSESYPQNRFLTTIGEGATRDQASTRALASMARIFSVSISETQLDSSSFSTSKGAKTEVSRHISMEARNELSHAKVVEYYQVSENQIFALAILEKSPLARKFREEISHADQQVRDLLAYASNDAPNLFSAMSALKQARHYQWQRENTQRNLLVVSNNRISSKHTLAEVENIIRNSVAQLEFSVDGDDALLVSQVDAGLATLGANTTSNSGLVLRPLLTLEPAFEQGGWFWLRGSLTITAIQNSETVAQKRWTMKESGLQEGIAQQRLRDTLAKKIPDYLVELMTTDPAI